MRERRGVVVAFTLDAEGNSYPSIPLPSLIQAEDEEQEEGGEGGGKAARGVAFSRPHSQAHTASQARP